MSDQKRLSVVLLADRFEVRGSSAYTLRLARNLGTFGIDVRVVTPDAQAIEAELRNSLPIREYPRMRFPVWGRIIRGSIRQELQESPPDVIHIQSRSMLSVGQWLARRLKVPCVLTLHAYLGGGERLRLDRRLVWRIICVSQSVKSELLQRVAYPPDRVTVVHAGVETPAMVETSTVFAPDKLPVVGTAGPLEAVKGLPFFLGAAHRVHALRKDVQFLVAGAGPEEANLRRLVRTLDLTENVTFVPRLYDYATCLAAMDVFCLPSLKQGLGTIMLEAMALGKPVIATGVGGVYSVIRDEETGLVVPPSDSARLAERMLELLDDPVRARALGAAGQRLVREEFNVEKMVRETVQVYRDVDRSLREQNSARGASSLPSATTVQ